MRNVLNEEVIRMQKLAGILNEQVYDGDDNWDNDPFQVKIRRRFRQEMLKTSDTDICIIKADENGNIEYIEEASVEDFIKEVTAEAKALKGDEAKEYASSFKWYDDGEPTPEVMKMLEANKNKIPERYNQLDGPILLLDQETSNGTFQYVFIYENSEGSYNGNKEYRDRIKSGK